ncbi:MAG: hypothetical protein LKJ13_07240 [Clostridia bacterium]|nr:hypothetical protein [Clostridia bacterium]MCI2000829.1 hypothetical protein [Clostridia bacterium]MCI2015379.1 hypothetical protein [Clostridia bacterium]
MNRKSIIKAYDSLNPDKEAKERMLQNILSDQKNRKNDWRKYNMKKRIFLAVIAAALITASGSIYATYKWHQASEAAQFIGDDKLTEAFGKTKQDIKVEESGKYRIAFLGTVSGKNISDEVLDGQDSGQTYAAVAIERIDQTPMDYDSELVISPLIQGLNPMEYNIYSMGGGASSVIKDGVLYSIASCKDIEMFADRDLYLAVTGGPSYAQAYHFDKDSGVITKDTNYDGVNCLFNLPIDSKFADKEKAEEFIQKIKDDEKNDNDTSSDSNSDGIVDKVSNAVGSDAKNIDKIKALGKCIYQEKEKPDENGNINVSYDTEEYGGANGTFAPVFENGSKVIITSVNGSDDYAVIEICTLNDDKTITVEEYTFDEKSAEELIKSIQAK